MKQLTRVFKDKNLVTFLKKIFFKVITINFLIILSLSFLNKVYLN